MGCFWRRCSSHRGGGFIDGVILPLFYHGGFWHEVILLQSFANVPLFFACFALFPNGRWAPRWMRWIFLCCCLITIVAYLARAFFSHTVPGWGLAWVSLVDIDWL
jgi:hypothetical protein